MNRFCLTAALAATTIISTAAAPVPEAPDRAHSVHLEVDLSEGELYIYQGGDLMNSFPVGVGTEEHPTPTGDFTVDRIIWNPDWIPPDTEWAEDETRKEPGDPENPMQGAKIFFAYPDYYIHGTNAPESVGSAVSHGCLRMRENAVEDLAQFLQRVGGEDRSDAWFEEIRRSDTKMTEVSLPDPIPMTIRE